MLTSCLVFTSLIKGGASIIGLLKKWTLRVLKGLY